MKTLCLLPLVIALAAPCAALDLAQSGSNFVQVCSAAFQMKSSLTHAKVLQNAACAQFVQGVVEGSRAENERINEMKKGTFPPLFDIPREVTASQELLITLKYINENPEKAGLATCILVREALQKVFPFKAR